MNLEKIIIGIGILIGIFLIKKTKPKLIVGILVGLIISFVLSFAGNQLLTNISFVSFGILSLIFSVHSVIKRKWQNLIIGIFAFILFCAKLLHFPYAYELKLLMIIPIVSYALIFREKRKYKNELSVLTIFVTYELIEFINLIEFWMN